MSDKTHPVFDAVVRVLIDKPACDLTQKSVEDLQSWLASAFEKEPNPMSQLIGQSNASKGGETVRPESTDGDKHGVLFNVPARAATAQPESRYNPGHVVSKAENCLAWIRMQVELLDEKKITVEEFASACRMTALARA